MVTLQTCRSVQFSRSGPDVLMDMALGILEIRSILPVVALESHSITVLFSRSGLLITDLSGC